MLTCIHQFYPNHFKKEDFNEDTFAFQRNIWQRGLSDFTYKECLTTLEIWLNQEKFPPTLAEFKPLIAKMKNPEAFISPEKSWETVHRAVRRFGWSNEAKALETFSEPIKRAVRAVGGWQRICSTPDGKEWDFLRKNFIECYEEFSSDTQEQFLLPPTILKQLQERQAQQISHDESLS